MPLIEQILTPQLEIIVSKVLNLVPRRDKLPIETALEMLNHPIISVAAELPILYGLSLLGEYSHDDEAIRDEVRASIRNMKGAGLQKSKSGFKDAIARAMSFTWLGYSFSEVSYRIEGKKQATLDRIKLVDPRRYSFKGGDGYIQSIEYYSAGQPSVIEIPYENGLHLVNQPYLQLEEDPYGVCPLKRAYPYWEAHKLITAAIAVAGQRQATPLLVGKTKTGEDIPKIDAAGQEDLDSNGDPVMVNRGSEMLGRLEQAGNGSVLVIDSEDEEVQAIAQQASPEVLEMASKFFERVILLCWLIPETILSSNLTGTGDTGLNAGHMEIFGLSMRFKMEMVSEGLIDQIIARMLDFNHGTLDDYGEFPMPKEDSTDSVAMLNAIGKIITDTLENPIAGFGVVDSEIINRMRELAGV
jgi:hypothetical protein